MNMRGFSLIELLVLISIVSILLGLATINFNSWSRKYQAERQTRELHADIMRWRLTAMQRKQRIGIFLGPDRYVVRAFANDEDTTGDQIGARNLNFEIRKRSGMPLVINSDRIMFDSRGFTLGVNSNMTLVVMPLQINTCDNCIIVSAGRTNIGRMVDATTCLAR